MRLAERWQGGQRPTVSFEVFPPHDDKKGTSKLRKTLDELVALQPDFFSVTFGAAGSTREGSSALVRYLKGEARCEVLPYFAGYGMGPGQITAVLDAYRELGVENLLVVRGDPPADPGFAPHPESFPHASDLLYFIDPRYDFCLGAAGYPEGHKEAASREVDRAFLRLKIERGAEFVITQYTYDERCYFELVDRCRATGVQVPIVPGVMPIYSAKTTERLARLCGAAIPDELRAGMAALPAGDADALCDFGVELALRQCRALLARGVPGLHFYTMDRARSVAAIVQRLRAEGRL